MNITLKNIKHHKELSDETPCFSAVIYIDGKRAATVLNHGHGGPNYYDFGSPFLETRFHDYCNSLPPITAYFSGSLAMDADLYIGGLLERNARRADLQRLCRKGIVFRLKTDKPGEWMILKGRPRESAERYFQEKHQGQVELVVNDDLDAAVEYSMQVLAHEIATQP